MNKQRPNNETKNQSTTQQAPKRIYEKPNERSTETKNQIHTNEEQRKRATADRKANRMHRIILKRTSTTQQKRLQRLP